MVFDKISEMLSEIYKEGMASVIVTFGLRSPPDCRVYFNSAITPSYGSQQVSDFTGACGTLPTLRGWDFGNLRSIPCATSTSEIARSGTGPDDPRVHLVKQG
jgi:hypothetical protein